MASRFLFALVGIAAMTSSYAGDLSVRTTTPDGRPLAQAVITVVSPGVVVPEEATSTAIIDQVNRTFVPRISVVRRGTLVAFPNNDDIRHHVYSFSDAMTFELPLYKGIPSEPLKFDQAGIVTLACNIHDWMLAFVYVTDATQFAVTDDDGSATLVLDGSGPWTVTVWHPNQGTETEGVVHEVASGVATLSVVIEPSEGRGVRRLRRGGARYR